MTSTNVADLLEVRYARAPIHEIERELRENNIDIDRAFNAVAAILVHGAVQRPSVHPSHVLTCLTRIAAAALIVLFVHHSEAPNQDPRTQAVHHLPSIQMEERRAADVDVRQIEFQHRRVAPIRRARIRRRDENRATLIAANAVGLFSEFGRRTWVSGVGDDLNPCSRTAPCKTFAGAISKTASGGIISVIDPGGFGAVTITKAITRDGDTDRRRILQNMAQGLVINDSTFVLTLSNVTDEPQRANVVIKRQASGLDHDWAMFRIALNSFQTAVVDLGNPPALMTIRSTRSTFPNPAGGQEDHAWPAARTAYQFKDQLTRVSDMSFRLRKQKLIESNDWTIVSLANGNSFLIDDTEMPMSILADTRGGIVLCPPTVRCSTARSPRDRLYAQ